MNAETIIFSSHVYWHHASLIMIGQHIVQSQCWPERWLQWLSHITPSVPRTTCHRWLVLRPILANLMQFADIGISNACIAFSGISKCVSRICLNFYLWLSTSSETSVRSYLGKQAFFTEIIQGLSGKWTLIVKSFQWFSCGMLCL